MSSLKFMAMEDKIVQQHQKIIEMNDEIIDLRQENIKLQGKIDKVIEELDELLIYNDFNDTTSGFDNVKETLKFYLSDYETLEEYMKQVEPNFNSHIEKGTIEMNNEYYNLMEEKMARLINENQKYKEVIDKAIKYIDEYRDYQDVHKQIGIDQYEDVTEDILFEKNIEELLDILKEVE